MLVEVTTLLTLGILFGFMLLVLYTKSVNKENRTQIYIKESINKDLLEFIDIISALHSKSKNVNDNETEAYAIKEYFDDRKRTLKWLQHTIKEQLEFTTNIKYINDIKSIISIEYWLVRKYDNITMPEKNKHWLWIDTGNSEFQERVGDILKIALKNGIKIKQI